MDQEKFAQSDLKVLLVEDDREFADILRIRLSKETNPRLAITCLPTLQQAQQALTETTWDLILLDLIPQNVYLRFQILLLRIILGSQRYIGCQKQNNQTKIYCYF